MYVPLIRAMDDEDEVKLYFAITSNNIDRVHQLIKAGIDVNVMFNTNNSVSQSVWSPLHLCCAKGNEDCAKMLLSAGAHVNAKDKWSQTALMCSIITGERPLYLWIKPALTARLMKGSHCIRLAFQMCYLKTSHLILSSRDRNFIITKVTYRYM